MTAIKDSTTTAAAIRPQRVLVAHRYYWPDSPPSASLLRRIVRRFVADGHSVDVLTSQPSYHGAKPASRRAADEIVDGVNVRRLTLPVETGRPFIRLLNALRLCAQIAWQGIRHRYDVILVLTVPPVVGGIAASLTCKLIGARFMYLCMDIHPEAGSVSGEFAHPVVFNMLRRLDAATCRRANPVIVLSDDMAATLRTRPRAGQLKIKVLNNFNLPSDEPPPDSLPFIMDAQRLTVLFAGNVGRFQGLDAVVAAMAQLSDRDDIEFIIMGQGTERERLKSDAMARGARIRFVDQQPVHVAKEAMARASYGFVSLVPQIFRYAFPSKTMTYLAQGCPLIVAVEKESQLAREALDEGYGHWVPTDDADALAQLLTRLADNRAQQAVMAQRARAKAERDFSERAVLDQWSQLLQSPPVQTS